MALSRNLVFQTGMANEWPHEQWLNSVNKQGRMFVAQLRPGDLDEVPRADPYEECSGAGGEKSPATRLYK